MIRMINDLLSLSRMDLGKVELDLELVNLNELFNYILNRFDMMLEKDNNDTREVTKVIRSNVTLPISHFGSKSIPTRSFKW